MQALQKVVSAVRNARAEYGVELGRRIPAAVHARPPMRTALEGEAAVLAALAKLEPSKVHPRPAFVICHLVPGTLM